MGHWVDDIESPADLKEIPESELEEFADSCREKLIESVSKSGGHFGPNLGAVELTVALHYIFDSPRDKLVWDVGHQGYIHKMLTGRADKLNTIRKSGGISGFLKRSESEHDIFNAGHASTSISAAAGIATALADQEDSEVVSIIGDGSLTGGMAYEGLNNAGGDELDMVVVLNDNGMAIAESVGAITEYFDRLIHLPAYEQMKQEVKQILDRGPEKLGKKAIALAQRFELSLKNLVIPRVMFEELGFRYYGPVDGHNVDRLLSEFRQVKDNDGPRFVHVLTEKGHGYEPAAEDHYASHAVKPFNIDSGQQQEESSPKWSRRVGQTLRDLGDSHPDLQVITAAMRKGTQSVLFEEEYPERFHDVGIAEQHAVTFAGGLATQGKKPAVCIYSSFLQRAYDQVFHDVCLMDLPVKFFIDRASIVGGDGETHQGIFDLVYLRGLPEMVVGAPSTDREVQNFVKTALEYDEHPIAVRYPRATVETTSALDTGDLEHRPPGEGERLREGTDVSIVALGPMVERARAAAEQLAGGGIEADVINARWVSPLDRELLVDSIEKTAGVITVEEGLVEGGFGSAVLELMSRENLSSPTQLLGVEDGAVPHGNREEYLQQYGLTHENIAKSARQLLAGSEE